MTLDVFLALQMFVDFSATKAQILNGITLEQWHRTAKLPLIIKGNLLFQSNYKVYCPSLSKLSKAKSDTMTLFNEWKLDSSRKVILKC